MLLSHKQGAKQAGNVCERHRAMRTGLNSSQQCAAIAMLTCRGCDARQVIHKTACSVLSATAMDQHCPPSTLTAVRSGGGHWNLCGRICDDVVGCNTVRFVCLHSLAAGDAGIGSCLPVSTEAAIGTLQSLATRGVVTGGRHWGWRGWSCKCGGEMRKKKSGRQQTMGRKDVHPSAGVLNSG